MFGSLETFLNTLNDSVVDGSCSRECKGFDGSFVQGSRSFGRLPTTSTCAFEEWLEILAGLSIAKMNTDLSENSSDF